MKKNTERCGEVTFIGDYWCKCTPILRKRVNRLKYVNKIERSQNKLKMLSKQIKKRFASTSDARRANGLSKEVFWQLLRDMCRDAS